VNLWNWIEVGQLKNIPHVSSQGVSVVMTVWLWWVMFC